METTAKNGFAQNADKDSTALRENVSLARKTMLMVACNCWEIQILLTVSSAWIVKRAQRLISDLLFLFPAKLDTIWTQLTVFVKRILILTRLKLVSLLILICIIEMESGIASSAKMTL